LEETPVPLGLAVVLVENRLSNLDLASRWWRWWRRRPVVVARITRPVEMRVRVIVVMMVMVVTGAMIVIVPVVVG
jgi:hypothetical protein